MLWSGNATQTATVSHDITYSFNIKFQASWNNLIIHIYITWLPLGLELYCRTFGLRLKGPHAAMLFSAMDCRPLGLGKVQFKVYPYFFCFLHSHSLEDHNVPMSTVLKHLENSIKVVKCQFHLLILNFLYCILKYIWGDVYLLVNPQEFWTLHPKMAA